MTRAWIGTALLAGSWLLGRGYFSPARPIVWSVVVFVGVILLGQVPIRWPSKRQQLLALLLSLPAIWLLPIPYLAVPVLISSGLFLQLAPIPRRWPRTLGRGAVVTGTILFWQSLALAVYETLTARTHELPSPLAGVIGFVTRLLGVDSAVDGGAIAIRSMQEKVSVAATWELLLDPATVCFVVGGLVLLTLVRPQARIAPPDRCWWRQPVVRWLLATAIWIPLRSAVLLALILQRSLRAGPFAYPNVSDLLVNSWLHVGLVLFLGLVTSSLFAGLTNQLQHQEGDRSAAFTRAQAARYRTLHVILFGAGVTVLVFLFCWDPVGERKAGRIRVVERHSTWEPTTVPYGTETYGEAGSYNYAAAYAYCQQYFEMSRLLETEPINDATLRDCDVLIIKTPTARYSTEEVDAIVRFVEQGGSLLLVGDHTNVFNMNTYLNDIARHFGFTFRNDLLFCIGDPYKQQYQPSRFAHPVVQHLPPMHFAVSCSIDPGYSLGRMVIRNTGLWNLPPAYHESNYHPQAEYAPPMQYGAWCQLWSTAHGAGRILAFADSTLFSNFCVFQPGKAELLRSMLDWLNRSSPFERRNLKLLLVVAVVLVGGLLLALGYRNGARLGIDWLVFLGAALGGGSVTALAVTGMHRTQLSVPPKIRPMPQVVIDRTLSEVPLHTGAFSDSEEGVGYGMFEQWIPRIGNFTSRESGNDVFSGDAVVFLCPTRSVSHAFRDRLIRFVQSGGHVLVVDSPDVEGSTANSLLGPFGLASNHDAQPAADGTLKWSAELPELPLQASCEISGGERLGSWKNIPVAARAHDGQGTVTAIGFGSAFNDANMGTHWLPEPEPEVLKTYDVLYAILRAALPSTPTGDGS